MPRSDLLLKVQESISRVLPIFAFKMIQYGNEGILNCMVEFCDKTASTAAMKDHEWECDVRVANSEVSISRILILSQSFSLNLSPYNTSQILLGYATAMQSGSAPQLRPRSNWAHSQSCEETDGGFSPQVESQITLLPLILRPSSSARVPFSLDSVMTTGLQAQMTPQAFGRSSFSSICSPFQSPPSPTLTVPSNFSPPRLQSCLERIDMRRQTAVRTAKSTSSSVGHHNFVDVTRIRDGIDVRTTVTERHQFPSSKMLTARKIMLRNIPNKVDQAMLKRLIDESSWGKYDFMYLRIDFANNCKCVSSLLKYSYR